MHAPAHVQIKIKLEVEVSGLGGCNTARGGHTRAAPCCLPAKRLLPTNSPAPSLALARGYHKTMEKKLQGDTAASI